MDIFNYEFLNQTTCEPHIEILLDPHDYELSSSMNYYKDTYISDLKLEDYAEDLVSREDYSFNNEHAFAIGWVASSINPIALTTRAVYEVGGYLSAQISESQYGDSLHYLNGLLLKDFGSIYKHMFMLSCANPIKGFIDQSFINFFGNQVNELYAIKALNYLTKFNVITGVNIWANVASDEALVHFYDDYFKNQTKIYALDLKPKEFWDYRVPVTYMKRAFKDFSGDFLELFFDKTNVFGYEFKLASFTSQLFTNFSLETIFNGFHNKYLVSSFVGALAKYGTEAIATYHIKKTPFGAKFPNLATFCVIALECTAMIFSRNPIRD